MKTPMTLGQKKTKAIDQLLDELGVGMFIYRDLYIYCGGNSWSIRAETNADWANLCPVQRTEVSRLRVNWQDLAVPLVIDPLALIVTLSHYLTQLQKWHLIAAGPESRLRCLWLWAPISEVIITLSLFPLTPSPLSPPSVRHRYENLSEHQQAKISMPEATPATPKKVREPI